MVDFVDSNSGFVSRGNGCFVRPLIPIETSWEIFVRYLRGVGNDSITRGA